MPLDTCACPLQLADDFSHSILALRKQIRLDISCESSAGVALNKNSNVQGRSNNVVKVIFHAIRNCSKRKEFAPSFFPFRVVPILKKDAIEENHCLIQ